MTLREIEAFKVNQRTQEANSSWASKYRPVSFDELILPPDVEKVLKSFYDKPFIKGNILSYGEPGLGKTSLGRVFTLRLNNNVNDKLGLKRLGRKADDIDELGSWIFLPTGRHTQKVVLIEEIDNLSDKAQRILKDGLMENYERKGTFIATTNHPDSLKDPLLDRFHTKIHFKDLPIPKVFARLKFILLEEKIEFNMDELKKYVETNAHIDMRNLINDIEAASIDGVLKLDGEKHEPIVQVPRATTQPKKNSLASKYDKTTLSVKEMATELGITPKTLRKYMDKCPHKVPKFKKISPRKTVFRIEDIEEFLTSKYT